MEVRLLGPVELAIGDQVLEVGAPQQRLLLAVLAAEAGRLVGVESLIDRVWDEPPAGARRTLQVHLSRLRRLVEAAAPGHQQVGVVRRSGGYLLDLDPDRVDVHRFRRLADQARDRACPEPERVALLGEAIDLWRGRPLSDLSGAWVTRVRTTWEQQYLDAAVAWGNAALHAGEPRAVLPRLTELVREHPLVEPLAAVFMHALYAAGRASEALDYYATVRFRLAEELGTDPGPELQQLHRQILSADPGLAPATIAVDPRGVPRQLPAPPPSFTGRATELANLDQVRESSTVVITAIDGMAGIGKTALAVHAAHRIAERYPDGQLFIDLHGYTHGVAPVEPTEALDHLLRALGIPGPQIPQSLDQRAALYRSRLADQRMLILLDNAATETQVTPLLPGAPGCLVLITSRRRPAGLDHTHTLSLDTLPPADAVTLFRQTAGEGRLAGQPPDLLAELVELCGRLPLAIRIAAARLRSHPAWNPSHLIERLRDQQHRLAELEAGQRSVSAALDLSYQHLSADQQRTYRLLGLHPGPDIDVYATAALLDSTLLDADRMLEQLLEAHLLAEPTLGRYRFHDLTRTHAARTATLGETDPGRCTALDRLLDHHRHTTSVAMDTAYPYERGRRPHVPPAETPTPDLSDPTEAIAWLDIEHPNLLAAARFAADHGWPEHVLDLSAVLHRHLRTRGLYWDAEALHHQALTTARTIGDRAGELSALRGLGWIHLFHGRQRRALDQFGQALDIARTIGDRIGELDALQGLGWIHLFLGRHDRALDHYQQALEIARAIGNRIGEMNALNGLGHINLLQGRHDRALDHFGPALDIARATGNRIGEMNALTSLGHIHRLQGRYDQAADRYQQVLDLAREAGHRNWQFEALHGLGRLDYSIDSPNAARAHHRQALELATELGQPDDQARAHDGLAHAHHALNQPAQAREHWQQALEILSSLGTDHTEDPEANTSTIRAHLAALADR